MKNRILLPLALVFASNAATAATTADLTVTGRILPTSCSISLAGGSFDLGNIDQSTLVNPSNSLTAQSKPLSITCSGPARVAIRATDNMAGTASIENGQNFGLGTDASQNKIGHYRPRLLNILIDGSTGFPSRSSDSGSSWGANGMSYIYPVATSLNSWNLTADQNPPVAGQNITADLHIEPVIVSAAQLDTSQEIPINGSATIELVYL